ncbi:MAG TPA: 23S rRNA (cytosine(1962)-C(5))-methyltransferase RlmI, partial [Thermoanaerobaculia bacterium]|nr:23S rRNA (cytosine(1962)-C(5))-methyltransferase RlmI [Thermoanaerobaculia bacterium]
MQTLTLARGREAAAKRRHPWLFSGSLARGAPVPGGAVEVRDADGRYVGRGFASPSSPIAARVWTFEDRPLDAAFVAGRLDAAVALRAAVLPPDT